MALPAGDGPRLHPHRAERPRLHRARTPPHRPLGGVLTTHIATSALERTYDDFRLGPLDLELPGGSLTVVLGPSGSGKSSLLRLLAGLDAPGGGSVRFDARDVARVPPERRAVGLVFQDGALFPHLNVGENVAFGLRVRGAPAAERERRVADVLRLVGLDGKERRNVATLSGGERQRVALARAVAPNPSVLLLDEPFASLDRNLREELRDAVRALHDALSLTTLLVTHDREEALAIADRIVLMRDGRIVEAGEAARVFREPRTTFAARFLGSASIVRGNVAIPVDAVVATPASDGAWTVESCRHAGFHDEVRLARGAERVTARAPPGRFRAGDRAHATWDASVERVLTDAS